MGDFLKLAEQDDIKTGQAYITQVYNNSEIKHMKFIISGTNIYLSYGIFRNSVVARQKTDNGVPELIKGALWNTFKVLTPSANKAAYKWNTYLLNSSPEAWSKIWSSAVAEANANLNSVKNRLLSSLNSTPSVSTYNKIKRDVWILDSANISSSLRNRKNKGLEYLKKGTDQLAINSINSISKQIADILQKYKGNTFGFGKKVNNLIEAQKEYEMPKKSLSYINNQLTVLLNLIRQKIVTANININVIKNAADVKGLIKALEGKKIKEKDDKELITKKPVSKPTKKLPNTYKTRRTQKNIWAKNHPEAYNAVIELQKILHKVGNSRVAIQDKLSKKVSNNLFDAIRNTAYTGFRGEIDYDGQWGSNTTKALIALKQVLSLLPNGKLAANIDTGASISSPSGKKGYVYTSKDNKAVAAANSNVKLINDILSSNNIPGFNVSSGTSQKNIVLDSVPNVSWVDPKFLTIGIKEPSTEGVIIELNDLNNLNNFDSWATKYDQITGKLKLGYQLSGNINYWKTLIGKLLERARVILNSATEKTKNIANTYVKAIESLFRRLITAYKAWRKSNPNKTDKDVVTASELEKSLSVGAAVSAIKPTDTKDDLKEDLDVKRPGATPDRKGKGIPLDYLINTNYLARMFPQSGMRNLINSIPGIRRYLSINKIKQFHSRPENLFSYLFKATKPSWINVLIQSGYNPSDEAMVYDHGRLKSYTPNKEVLRYRDLPPNSPPALRIINEWKLTKVIQGLNSLKVTISNIDDTYSMNAPDILGQANSEFRDYWIEGINGVIRYARQRLREIRTGSSGTTGYIL